MLEQEKSKYIQYVVSQFSHLLPQELRQGGASNYSQFQAQGRLHQKSQSKEVLLSIF